MAHQEPGDPQGPPFQFPERLLPAGYRPPHDGEGHDDNHDDEERVPLSALCTLDEPDLELVCKKLDAEGILSEVRESPSATDDSGQSVRWDVLVRSIDLQAAKEAIARPLEGPHDREDNFDDDFYVVRGTCPDCRHDQLAEVALSPRRRAVRRICFSLIVLPPLVLILLKIALPEENYGLISNTSASWACTWGGVCVVLFIVGLGPTREKVCPKCGWRPTTR